MWGGGGVVDRGVIDPLLVLSELIRYYNYINCHNIKKYSCVSACSQVITNGTGTGYDDVPKLLYFRQS